LILLAVLEEKGRGQAFRTVVVAGFPAILAGPAGFRRQGFTAR